MFRFYMLKRYGLSAVKVHKFKCRQLLADK